MIVEKSIHSDGLIRFITWPLISLALCLTATVPLLNIIWTCFLTVVMVAMALGGALVRSEYKWGTSILTARTGYPCSLET